MYLKIKEMDKSKLVLDLTNGTYTIGIQVPALKIGDGVYTPMLTEIIEEYESMDYKIEEMVERFNTVYKVLKEENDVLTTYRINKIKRSNFNV